LISVLIPVRDETTGLRRAVESVRWIPVEHRYIALDPRGGNGIKELALNLAGNVSTHLYFDSASFKNKAIGDFDIKTEWLLLLDADEEVPEELGGEIRESIAGKEVDGFYIPRRNLIGGKWIKRGGWFPDHNIRLFRTGKGEFENRRVHSELKLDGKIGFLKNSILHHCREDVSEHRKYVARYARFRGLDAYDGKRPLGRLDLILFPKIPGKPVKLIWRLSPPVLRSVLLFMWLYWFKLGFLDGSSGIKLALAESSEPYLAARFRSRLRLRQSGPGTCRTAVRTLIRGFFRRAVRLAITPGALFKTPPDRNTIRDILVVHLFGMGDVIMALPFFERLRRELPDAGITILARPSAVELLKSCGYADSVREYTGLKTITGLRRDLKGVSFDLALLPFTGLSNFFAAKALGARVAAGYISGTSIESDFRMRTRPSDRGWNHPAEKALDLLNALGIGSPEFQPYQLSLSLKPPGGFEALVKKASGGRPYVVLYPGGFSPSRRLKFEKAAAVADYIRGELGYGVILVGDLFDRPDSERIESEAVCPVMNLTGITDTAELAAVLGDLNCLLAVAGDSGVMHLAIALGKPVVALFGPTSPALRLPSEFSGTVLRTPRDCAPCFGGEHEPVCRQRASCLDPIPLEQIFGAIKGITG